MSNFTTIISNPVDQHSATDVEQIGRAMGRMSENRSALLGHSNASISVVDMNVLKGLPDGTVGKQEAEEICDALAVAPVVGGVKQDADTIGARDCAGITAFALNVKFVFEDEHTMIVVIPDKGLLDYGLNNAPMEEATSYRAVVQRDIDETFANEMERLIDIHVSDADERENLKIAMEALVATRNPPLAEENIFYQQLGAYSVRQCD